MKLKELLKQLGLTVPKTTHELPRDVMRLIENSPVGRELAKKAAKFNCPITDLLAELEPAALLSPGAHFSSIVVDSSTSGFAAVLDGKQRMAWFMVFLTNRRLPGDIDLPVVELNCGPAVESDIAEDNWFIHPGKIRAFLKQHWQASGEHPREEVLSHFVRRIVRHLSAVSTNGVHATESALLALELCRFLPQVSVAQVLRRSEAWVSAAASLGKLEEASRQALEAGKISYSCALVIAEAGSAEERALLSELAVTQKLSSRSLRVALQFLKLNEGFARRADALSKLLKLLSERLVTIKENTFARLRLIFRNRRPLWQVRFFHKHPRRSTGSTLQTAPDVQYRSLMGRLREVEDALSKFPV